MVLEDFMAALGVHAAHAPFHKAAARLEFLATRQRNFALQRPSAAAVGDRRNAQRKPCDCAFLLYRRHLEALS